MREIIIKIGASSDYYGAYAENCDGIYGAGPTPEAAKADALKGLELFVNSRDRSELPAILQGEYTIAFEYDTQSLLLPISTKMPHLAAGTFLKIA